MEWEPAGFLVLQLILVRCKIYVAMHNKCVYILPIKQIGHLTGHKEMQMSKTPKSEETVFAAFDASKVTDQVRDFAEKSVAQTKDAYAKMKESAEGAQKTFEDNIKVAQAASSEVALKAIAALRTNADAGISHLEALVGVKSFSDFVELQTSFFRKQAEMVADQAKELQAVTTAAAEKVSAPVKAAFEKAAKEFKAA
jgi:phasin